MGGPTIFGEENPEWANKARERHEHAIYLYVWNKENKSINDCFYVQEKVLNFVKKRIIEDYGHFGKYIGYNIYMLDSDMETFYRELLSTICNLIVKTWGIDTVPPPIYDLKNWYFSVNEPRENTQIVELC